MSAHIGLVVSWISRDWVVLGKVYKFGAAYIAPDCLGYRL